jgi:hypothetical protein
MGGRRAGVDKDHGDIFDHHAVEFEYRLHARRAGKRNPRRGTRRPWCRASPIAATCSIWTIGWLHTLATTSDTHKRRCLR